MCACASACICVYIRSRSTNHRFDVPSCRFFVKIHTVTQFHWMGRKIVFLVAACESQKLPPPPMNYMPHIHEYIILTHILYELGKFRVFLFLFFFFFAYYYYLIPLLTFSPNAASLSKLQSMPWCYIDFDEHANRFANILSNVMWLACSVLCMSYVSCCCRAPTTQWSEFIVWIEINATYDLEVRILNAKLVFYCKLNWWLNLSVGLEFAMQCTNKRRWGKRENNICKKNDVVEAQTNHIHANDIDVNRNKCILPGSTGL